MLDIIINSSLAIGAAFVLVAAIGLIRLPDLLTRMHAATKAGTLGAGMLYVAVALAVPGDGVAVKSAAIIAFLLLTAPIASHVIARAAYHRGEVDLWDQTQFDELDQALYRRPEQSSEILSASGGSDTPKGARATAGGAPGNEPPRNRIPQASRL